MVQVALSWFGGVSFALASLLLSGLRKQDEVYEGSVIFTDLMGRCWTRRLIGPLWLTRCLRP